MTAPDDQELANQLASLRPRAVSQEFADGVAQRLKADPHVSRRRARRRLLFIGGAAAASVLMLITAITFLPGQPGAPVNQRSAESQIPPASDESDSPVPLPTYAVLRAALADSPERLMALLDEQSSRPAGTPTRVWRYLDRDFVLQEEIP